MKFNQIFKSLTGLACLFSVVYAGDCGDIDDYLKNKQYADKIIEECIENENGEVFSLKINNARLSLSQKDIDKLTSYKTLTNLEYKYNQEYIFNVSYDFDIDGGSFFYDEETGIILTSDRDDEKKIPEITVPNFNLDGLTNLTEFKLTSYSQHNVYSNPYVYGWIKIEPSKIASDNTLNFQKQ